MDAPRKLEWTHEQIARFWDYTSAQNDLQKTYFAGQVGDAVVKIAQLAATSLEGLRVLDFGSGPGHLIPKLLKRNATVFATDYSPKSVDETVSRFGQHPKWGGAELFDGKQTAWPDNSFDVVFCLETIEHLHDEDCTQIFDELNRVLRPGGFALYTTPYEEDLSKHNVYCPSCNCEFHRMQHMRSWSVSALTDKLQQQNYQVDFCGGLDLHDFQRPTKIRFSTVRRYVKNGFLRLFDRLLPRSFPNQRLLTQRVKPRRQRNLVAIARKLSAATQTTARAA